MLCSVAEALGVRHRQRRERDCCAAHAAAPLSLPSEGATACFCVKIARTLTFVCWQRSKECDDLTQLMQQTWPGAEPLLLPPPLSPSAGSGSGAAEAAALARPELGEQRPPAELRARLTPEWPFLSLPECARLQRRQRPLHERLGSKLPRVIFGQDGSSSSSEDDDSSSSESEAVAKDSDEDEYSSDREGQ